MQCQGVDITAEKIQFFLETAWITAPANANSLRDQLFSYETTVRNLTRGGTLASVSKNSASQSYRGPGLGQYTPDQLGDAWRMLINLYDEISNWVKWAANNPPTNPPADWPTVPADGDYDPQVYPRMQCRTRGVEEYQCDVSDLRLHPTLFSGQTLVW